MIMFSKLFKKQQQAKEQKDREEKAIRLSTFLEEVEALEKKHSCEIRAKLQATPTGIFPTVNAVVLEKPKDTNDQPTDKPDTGDQSQETAKEGQGRPAP